eukprot:9093955-Pyramimonas_sp.AAC.1
MPARGRPHCSRTVHPSAPEVLCSSGRCAVLSCCIWGLVIGRGPRVAAAFYAADIMGGQGRV